MHYETLDALVRKLRPEMIDFTTELVGIASENPPAPLTRSVSARSNHACGRALT